MNSVALQNNDRPLVATPTIDTDAEVVRLAALIDLQSALSIQEFGREIAERSTAYTDELLSSAKASDLDETGERLTEIVLAAQEFNLNALDNPMGRIPVFGGFLKRLSRSKEKVIAKFDTVKGQVDRLVSQIDTAADTLNRRNRDYQTMYASVRTEHTALGQHVKAIRLRLVDMDVEIGKLDRSPDDLEGSEYLAILEANRQQLAKRADDMTVLQHSTMQTLPMIRIIQSNNLALVDKFQTIRQLTLPAWKRAFMLALTLDEQKNAVALANNIDNATNELMRRNADLLHQNSVETAKANQRLVIDVDTLKHVHDKILLTLCDVRQAHQQGAVERHAAIGELERLRSQMADTIRSSGVADA
jgi:uncharacterized protein YaaN involved in tellurite resistance